MLVFPNDIDFKSLVENLRVRFQPASSNISVYYKSTHDGLSVLVSGDYDLEAMLTFHDSSKYPIYLEVMPSADTYASRYGKVGRRKRMDEESVIFDESCDEYETDDRFPRYCFSIGNICRLFIYE